MRLTEMAFDGPTPVDGYGPGFFRVAGQVWQGPVLVSARGVTQWGGLGDWAQVLLIAGQIDVLFVGIGAEMAHLAADQRQLLETAGIGVEVMTTPSACRTFNVLLSEGRRVAVALEPV